MLLSLSFTGLYGDVLFYCGRNAEIFFAGRVMADLTEDRYVVFHDWDLTLHLKYLTVAFLLLAVKSTTH